MKKSLHIVCHAFPSWHGDYVKSTVELMKELACNNKVLYIDYAYTLKDLLLSFRKNTWVPVSSMLGLSAPLRKVDLNNGGQLLVLSLPPVLPINWIGNQHIFNFFQSVNARLMNRRILNAVNQLEMKDPLVINAFNPTNAKNTLKGLDPKAILYYCYDNISAAAWACKHGSRFEKNLIREADAVIFSSDDLNTTKGKDAKAAYVIKNGVDLSVFKRDQVRQVSAMTKQTVQIGYIGSVDDRLDYELLFQTIQNHPHWQFHFIGRILDARANKLQDFANVIMYGAVEPHELPGLMKHFNAGIIPFVKNDFTQTIYPMKANEYLAMGLPVVMTDFAQLNDLKHMVSITNRQHFNEMLELAVQTDSEEKKLQRIAHSETNSWKCKASELESILYQYA